MDRQSSSIGTTQVRKEFATLLDVKAKYSNLVCIQCRYAVPRSHVERRLKERNKCLSLH